MYEHIQCLCVFWCIKFALWMHSNLFAAIVGHIENLSRHSQPVQIPRNFARNERLALFQVTKNIRILSLSKQF
jgi:hypothetical protein